jgi:hypothetical protein
MSAEQREYARALVAYRKVLKRLSEAKFALAKTKTKASPRVYTLAQIDALFPPSPTLLTLRAVVNRRDTA